MTVSPHTPRPGASAETDRAASQAVDNLTAYVTNYMDTRKPTTVRGVVTAVTRDATGINEVSIQRTGQAAADGSPYVVYAQGFVPIVNDRITLQKLGTSWLVVGADHGGRPNEHTIAYTGGSHRTYNAARVKQYEHFDTHHAVHYATDGATVAHHNHPSGQKAHTADHIHNATSITATGVRTGGHRKTHNAGTGRYEHHGPTDELVREHAQGYHAHYTTATRKHLHNDAGHTHPAGHSLTDVSGVWTVTHSSGNKVQTHDGIIHTAYANGVIGHQIDAYKHYFRSGQNWEMARVEAAGSTTSTGGGRLHVKQLNTANTHILGDDGAGNLYIQHGAGNKVLDHDGTSHTLYHAPGGVVRTHDGTAVRHQLTPTQHIHPAGHNFMTDASGNFLLNDPSARTMFKIDTTGNFYLRNASGSLTTLQAYINALIAIAGGYGIKDPSSTYLHHYFAAPNSASGGHKKQTGDHVHNTTINSDGTHSGGHRKTHNATSGRYEHHGPTDELVREHAQGYHAHWTTATRKHMHDDTGHTHPAGHSLKDMTGVWTVTHSSGNKVQTHDGIIHTTYANGVVAHQIDAYKHYFRSGQNWEMARFEAAGSLTSIGGGRLHVKQYNTANTHIIGDDGGGVVYIQHGAGNRVIDYNGTLNTLYHAAGSQVRTFDGTNVQHILKGNQHQILQAGSSSAYHTFGDDTTGKTAIFNAAGNRVLDHDNATFRGYANAGALGWTHDGTTHQHYRGGVATVALTSAGHVYATAADGGIVTVKQSATTNGHQFGDDGSGNTHIQHPTGGRVLVHNGTTFTGYAGGASQIGWTHDGVTHTHQAGGVGYHKLTTSAVQFGGSTTGAVHAMKQHGSSSMHLAGDDGAGLLHLAHATAGKVYDHTGALMRHLVSGNPALTHDGTTLTHYRGGVVTTKLTTTGAVFATATDGGLLTTKQASATGAHLFGDDGAGLVHIAHATAGKVYDHNGTLMRQLVNGNLALTHDGTTLAHYRGGTITTQLTSAGVVYGTAADGGILSLRLNGSATAKHQYGDDGSGNAHIRHGGGNLALTHTGSIATIYAGSGGGAAIKHDGSTHTITIPGSTYAGIVHGAAGTGATMSVRSGGNNATNHAVGDDTTGALQAYSQGDHHIRVSAGVGDHHHTPTSHIFPPNSRVNAYSDRLDLLEQSNTYGAIKRNSHSIYIVYDQQACTIPAAGGQIIVHGSNDTYDTPHFKLTEHVVWSGTNSGGYRHVAPNPTANSGYGSVVDGSTTMFWNELETYGNNTTAIFGKSISGANQTANSTQKYIGVNA